MMTNQDEEHLVEEGSTQTPKAPGQEISDDMSTGKKIFKVLLILFTIGLSMFDLTTDILNGLDLIGGNFGEIILALVFLPAVVAIFLGFYQDNRFRLIKNLKKTSSSYKYTLVDVDWFDLEENRDENLDCLKTFKINLKIFGIALLILLRIYSFVSKISYIVRLFLKKEEKKESDKKTKMEKLEQRIRADEFLDAVFESLPQCCVQLYIFGLRSTVTHLQVVSLFSSIVTLLFEIVKISITRELLIREVVIKKYRLSRETKKSTGKEFELKPITYQKAKENQAELSSDSKADRFASLGKISKSNDNETLELSLLHNDVPSKKIVVNLEYTFDKENKGYFITDKNIRGKQMSIKIENNLFYIIRIFHLFVEGFTFFIPILPAVALFSSLYGRFFLFLYVPVLGHFIAEFWWWRAHKYKKRFTMAFHTIFCVFKFLERMFIVIMISVWFIKVIDYSNPFPPHTTCPIPSSIYPEPNQFLKAIASYEKDGIRKDWAPDCEKVKSRNITIDLDRIIFSKIPFCAIDPSTYIFCIVFYINVTGFFFDMVAFLAYLVFHKKFKNMLGEFEVDNQKTIDT